MEIVYLGDGAYARFSGKQLVVFTSAGGKPLDEVYLEPEVYAALLKFVAKAGEEHGYSNSI